ncbi:MAG: glycoside hydrolase family 97 catalytic domain-containing protein [Bacteroidales bacterium]|nr:glycoside hydrolase family 97 catalytic domain-containing protein [Bacteroidales bacterium]
MDLTVDNHVWEHALGRHFEQPAHWFDNLRLEGCDTLSRDTTWHNTVLPFTRSLCGPDDYTVCYFDPRLVHTTHAHQLVLSVAIFDPLMTLYWYDFPERIAEVEELEFFDAVPAGGTTAPTPPSASASAASPAASPLPPPPFSNSGLPTDIIVTPQ